MAREKTEKVVFTFHTTTMAMRMEQCAKDAGSPGRLIPVPRQISAGCGMAWSAPAAERLGLESLIQENGIETEGIHNLFL
ncbi:DUF3343 domain-containing protein [Lachnoclostridium pacaense]|uniref:DUF3343 domain-containing protein n=1 Tax=Enterocloster hominis (ex Hitch et al. 2024) TaxID=1917870 RepID=UPI001D10876B|nr:DUF3343 domain-containing protein [Lachnoclostridium pacaense]MCC2876875.1 DUF3343 domain-containing protein [Lachnoclostridium pacaense]